MKKILPLMTCMIGSLITLGQSKDTIYPIFADSSAVSFEVSRIEQILERVDFGVTPKECASSWPMGGVHHLLKCFEIDLNTKAFHGISHIYSVRFCLNEEWSSLSLQQWNCSSDEEASQIIQALEKSRDTTIFYKPPQNWNWKQLGKSVFFLYSEMHPVDSNEMTLLFGAVNSLE